MVGLLVSCGLVLLLFLSGRLFEAFKYLLKLICDYSLKLLSLFGIYINVQEKKIKTSQEFKDTFKDIRKVKQSKTNEKIKPSINRFAFITLVLSLALIIINLNVVSGNCISVWLYNQQIFAMFIDSQRNMDVTFTATAFSILSFSISKLITQWKETKKYRDAKKEIKFKKEVANTLTSKDLLDMAKQLDVQNTSKIKKDNKVN